MPLKTAIGGFAITPCVSRVFLLSKICSEGAIDGKRERCRRVLRSLMPFLGTPYSLWEENVPEKEDAETIADERYPKALLDA